MRSSVQVVLGSVLAGVGLPPVSGCNSWSSCPSRPDDYRPPLAEWTTEATNQALIEHGAISGELKGPECESLCGEGRYFYDNSCKLTFDPRALESAQAASDVRGKGQMLRDGFGGQGGAGGEGGTVSLGGYGGDLEETPSTGGLASIGGASAGGKTSSGGSPTSTGGAESVPTVWSVQISCSGVAEYPCEGRRHASWGPVEATRCPNALGAWFARAARSEASSVHSFRALGTELQRTQIGSTFTRRLRKAARDEIRHARWMEREAIRYSARRPRQAFTTQDKHRSLEELALENAREGCVFEMYSALEMQVLAARAESAEHRELFASIAADEMEHAELAWDLHAAFLEALPLEARARVELALRDALLALGNAPPAAYDDEVHAALGLPQGELGRKLRAGLAHEAALALAN